MSATRFTMRKIREVLRLKFDWHLTNRQIAKSCTNASSYSIDRPNRHRCDMSFLRILDSFC
jgi:hypothetical protein